VTPETDFPTRFLVCDALTAAGRHNDVVDLLQSVTSTRFDSPALRMLLAAAVNSDRRATLAKLLKDIPAEILKLLYYRRVGIALAFSTGDIRSAERQLREFLAIEPKNLAIHLELLNALFRQNKQSDLKADSALSSSDFNGSPENFIRFAQFKKDFADWKEAHDLAYRVLLANQGNESVNIGYMAIFLFERRPTPIDLNPAIVAENMAIGVKREDGHISTYAIEPEPSLRPTTDYLAPNHAVARLLLGKSAGDSVELPDHTEARIVWVKPKELHALHVILENFNNVFPDAEGFEKVRVDASSPGALEPILERVRERHDVVSSIARKYDSGTLPLALMARLVGTDPVSAAVGIASSGHALRVCEGTQYERDMSFQVIAQNDRKGCVVDAVTLHFIRRLGLERVVEAVCGPIGVVERSVSRIQQSAALAVQQADRTWIAERAQLIPAEGGKDPSPAWGRQRFGSSFFDEARAASGSGRLFLSEDLPMRMLAQTEYGVGGCWLQPVLMKAVETRHMTNDEYLGAIVALIDANEEFISVSSSLLAYSLKAANSHALPSSFRKLAGRLGGAKADLTSHISVAFELIHRTWRDESLSPTLRQAIVGLLLENLVRDRNRSEVTAIMGTFDDFAASVEKSENLRRYLRDWLQGHFIILG
jgi:hypothetical protein